MFTEVLDSQTSRRDEEKRILQLGLLVLEVVLTLDHI